MPPPVHTGEREEPARARPVPFWRHGLAPPPETLPRVSVDAVPRRRAFSSARTVSWTSGMLKRASNAAESSSTVPPPSTEAVLAIGPYLHHAPAWARNCASHKHQVALGHHLDDRQTALGHSPTAHPAGATYALEHARRSRRGADRAGRANV